MNRIFKQVPDKVIVSSRPFAVIDLEADPNVKFLRLKGFNIEEQRTYFGSDDFERAKEICRACPQLLATPMLAYMVRFLIKNKSGDSIRYRKDLYHDFISRILTERSNFRSGKKTSIRRALGKISYEAIAKEAPLIQIIPMYNVVESLAQDNIDIDELLQSGLAHMVFDKTADTNECLYFTHQSFQEYLAAEYISQNNDLYEKVIKEKGKWEGVIAFLAGIKGQVVIENILEEKNDFLDFSLLLITKTTLECEISSTLREKILDKIKSSFLSHEFEESLIYIDKEKGLKQLFESIDNKYYLVFGGAMDFFKRTQGNLIEPRIVKKIIDKLNDKDVDVQLASLRILGIWYDQMDKPTIQKIISKLNDNEDDNVRWAALEVLEKLKEKIMETDVVKIVDTLKSKNRDILCAALRVLETLHDKICDSDVIQKIGKQLENKDSYVRYAAIHALSAFHNKLPDEKIINEIIKRLKDRNNYVRYAAVQTLGKLNNNKDDGIIVSKIINVLNNENQAKMVRCAAGSIISQLGLLQHRSIKTKIKSTPELYRIPKEITYSLRILS